MHEALDFFDNTTVQYVNSLARRSGTLDYFVVTILTNSLLKGAVPIALLYWAWFRADAEQAHRRTLIVGTMMAAFVGLAIGRTAQLYLPFRPRPLYNPELALRFPYSLEPKVLEDWSSLPSDHAALFATLAFGIWLISRRLGVVALLHALVFVAFPKLYAGQHYPSDLLAGAAVGIGTSYLVLRSSLPELSYRRIARWQDRAPGLFYAAFFVVALQVATLFDDIRALGSVARFALPGFLRMWH